MTDNKQFAKYQHPSQESFGASSSQTAPSSYPGTMEMATTNNGAPPIGFSGLGEPRKENSTVPNPPMGFHMPIQTISQPDPNNGPKTTFGAYSNSNQDVEGLSFSEKTIRRAFIRKVYAILSIQLLLTASIIALFSFHDGVKKFVQSTPAVPIASYIVAIVLLIAMACWEGLRRKSPHNFILLGVFTLTYGVVIGVISSLYEQQAVVMAAIITTVLTVSLTAFAFQTKIDFTVLGGALFCCLIVMIIFGLLMAFLPNISILRKVFACLGALLFSVYLIYDTQLMTGGTHKCSISPEEYVFAALNLYLDIIMIFVYILRLFGQE